MHVADGPPVDVFQQIWCVSVASGASLISCVLFGISRFRSGRFSPLAFPDPRLPSQKKKRLNKMGEEEEEEEEEGKEEEEETKIATRGFWLADSLEELHLSASRILFEKKRIDIIHSPTTDGFVDVYPKAKK